MDVNNTSPFERPKSGWFSFQRRTLWIIIFALVPAIVFLNNSGKSVSIDSSDGTTQEFNVQDLEFNQAGSNWWVNLAGSGVIAISIATLQQPITPLDIPEHQTFETTLRNGLAITYVKTPAEKAALDLTLDFLNLWLPPKEMLSSLVVAGEVNQDTLEYIIQELTTSRGRSIEINVHAPDELTVIPLPGMGQADQMAHIMAAGILQQRMAGYDIQLKWNHQGPQSYITLNSTISPEWLDPITQAEFQQAYDEMLAIAERPERSLDQIHRYLTTVSIYQLSSDFIINQSKLISQTNLEQVQAALNNFAQ